MYLTNYQYDLLRCIYKKPYISYQSLKNRFSKKYRFVLHPPFFIHQKYFDETKFKLRIDFLKDSDLLTYTPAKTDEQDTVHYKKKSNINDNMHLLITDTGAAHVEEHDRNSRNFWVPYCITTAIASSALFIQAVSLLIQLSQE